MVGKEKQRGPAVASLVEEAKEGWQQCISADTFQAWTLTASSPPRLRGEGDILARCAFQDELRRRSPRSSASSVPWYRTSPLTTRPGSRPGLGLAGTVPG